MWMSIVFFLGMLSFLFVIILSKLYKFKGTKLKDRLSYALAFSLFLTLFSLWQSKGDLEILFRGLILGILLGIPFCIYSKRWINNKVEGTKIFYKKKRPYINMLWSLLGVMLGQVLIRHEYGRNFIESVWPMLGICLSWFFSQVFMFYYVVKLEKALGSPILEDNKAG